MSRRYLIALTSVLYFTCLTAFAGMISHAFNICSFRHGEKIFLGCIIVISYYLAACFRCISLENRGQKIRIIRRHLYFLFAFYIVMVIDFTLIDDSLGRNILNVFKWNETAIRQYWSENTNFIPFATVKLFIKGYTNNKLTFSAMIENLLGNLVVFMPLPFFVRTLFGNIKKWYLILLTVLISVVIIEFLQFVFLTGASDIDDIILNVSGSMLFYGFLNIKKVSKGISKITFGEWRTVETKD